MYSGAEIEQIDGQWFIYCDEGTFGPFNTYDDAADEASADD